jgi:hypothetical protein
MRYKIGRLWTLAFRALKICSNECLQDEMVFLEKVLMENDYPVWFIAKHLRIHRNENVNMEGPEKKQLFVQLPFRWDLHDKCIQQRITSGINNTFLSAKLIISHSTRTLMLFNIKDKRPTSCQSQIVSEFKCICSCFVLRQLFDNYKIAWQI